MKELRRQIVISLIPKINGTIGNLLQDTQHTDSETVIHFGRLIKSPEIHLYGDTAKYLTKDNYLTVLLIMDNENLTILKQFNKGPLIVSYDRPLKEVDVDDTFNELCKAIGYKY